MSRRLFFALWPDDGVRRALAAWQRAHLPDDCRPTHPADLHLTLHFLGQVEEVRLRALLALGRGLPLPAFSLDIERIGYWARPRVLWAGPARTPLPLTRLHAQLGRGLQALGFELDPRPFRPHVTLARKVRRPPAETAPPSLRWEVREWALLESRPGGRPLYHPLARWRAV